MTVLRLKRTAQGWMATYTGGATAREIVELFGTNTIPTAYRKQAPAEQVLAAIRKGNPTCRVELA